MKGSDKFIYKLENLCARYSIELSTAHGAMPDVLATKEIFTLLISNFRKSAKKYYNALTKQSKEDEVEKSRKFFEMP
jgi:DNA polymerase III epsilon subunit-like protein